MVTESLTTEVSVVGGEDFVDFMRLFRASLQGTEVDVEGLSKQMKEMGSAVYGGRRALMLARTEIRLGMAEWLEFGRLMGDIGSVGRSLTQMWQAYTIGIIRVEMAQRDVDEATKNVGDAQDRYNRYLEVFGEDSVYTKDALDDLNDAIADQEEAMKKANKAQQDMAAGYVTMGLQATGFASSIIMMIYHLKVLGALSTSILPSIMGLTAVLTPFAAVAVGAAGVALMVAQLPAAYERTLEARRIVEETYGREEALGRTEFHARVAEVLREAEYTPTGATVTRRGGQFGIPRIPATGWYYLHREEEVVPSVRARRGAPTVREVNITQYNTVSSDFDLDRLAEEFYRKLMKKMEAIR